MGLKKLKLKKRKIRLSSSLGNGIQNKSRIQRLMRPLAFMVATGRSNAYIARRLGVMPQTIRRWKEDPEVQQTITDVEVELHEVFEREFQGLFGASIKAAHKVLKSREWDQVVEMIKTIWKSHGRYTEKGDTTLINNQQNLALGDMDRDDAFDILKALREARRADEAKEITTQKVISGAE